MKRVYLDHAATTPLNPEVLEAMKPYLTDHCGNASSVHQLGRQARVAVEESRERVAACIGTEPSEIVFTSGGTEADNLALKGVLDAESEESQRAGLVTSAAEHKAVLEPAKRLKERGHPVTILDPDHYGAVSPEQVEAAIDDRMALVSLMHVNNEIGVKTDIRAIGEICREHDVLLHCDAVQSAGLHTPDVDDLGVDLTFSRGARMATFTNGQFVTGWEASPASGRRRQAPPARPLPPIPDQRSRVQSDRFREWGESQSSAAARWRVSAPLNPCRRERSRALFVTPVSKGTDAKRSKSASAASSEVSMSSVSSSPARSLRTSVLNTSISARDDVATTGPFRNHRRTRSLPSSITYRFTHALASR